jgi:hypothetical protein
MLSPSVMHLNLSLISTRLLLALSEEGLVLLLSLDEGLFETVGVCTLS